jgi:hypothetical protein
VHSFGAVFGEVADHFSASHREADKGYVVQLEFDKERLKVFGESVEAVAGVGLMAVAESTAVISDDAITNARDGWWCS